MMILTPYTLMPALVLDLDGTIRLSKSGDFINGPGDVALFGDVEAKLWEYREKGFIICGVSNQGGVAFGYKLPFDAEAELDAMLALFSRPPFHIIKQAYHHPKGTVHPWNYRSLLRKPDIGMLVLCEIDAWEAHIVIDWDASLMVGDRQEDRECAERAGITFQDANDFFGRMGSDHHRAAV
jgi:D-glycero-D-manno-heptose 1,7-bisphosphate phosphatase